MIVIRRSQLLLTNKKDILLSLADKQVPRFSLKYQQETVFVGYQQEAKKDQQKVTIGFLLYLNNQIDSEAHFDGAGKVVERR